MAALAGTDRVTLDEPAPIVLIAGEGGIGKSCLLSSVARRARDIGLCVLVAGCFEEEGRLPYGPFHDLLLDFIRAQPDGAVRVMLAGLEGSLTRIVPELVARLDAAPAYTGAGGEAQRLQLYSAVAQLLARISAQRRVVLMLDDLHWADESTVQLLHFLFRQPELRNVCIVGAYRRGASETCTTLDAIAGRSTPTSRVRSVILQPQAIDAMRGILDSALGEEVRAILPRHSTSARQAIRFSLCRSPPHAPGARSVFPPRTASISLRAPSSGFHRRSTKRYCDA